MELAIRLFDQPGEFALRGRSAKTVIAALLRGAAVHGPWLRQVARWVEELASYGWRYRGYTGDTLVFRSTKALDETEATAYVRRRLGQDALARVSLREGTVPLMRNGRPWLASAGFVLSSIKPNCIWGIPPKN